MFYFIDGDDEGRNSHFLFTLNLYQYRVEKGGKGGGKVIFYFSIQKRELLNIEKSICLLHAY